MKKYKTSDQFFEALYTCALSGAPMIPFHAHSNTPPHFAHSLRPVLKCLTLADGKALVSALATMLLVGQ